MSVVSTPDPQLSPAARPALRPLGLAPTLGVGPFSLAPYATASAVQAAALPTARNVVSGASGTRLPQASHFPTAFLPLTQPRHDTLTASPAGHTTHAAAAASQTLATPALPGNTPFLGGASRWLTGFKFCTALIFAGGVNSFLFGVPVRVAIGLAVLIASLQSLIALKIHREDTRFSRWLVNTSRRLTHHENDPRPSSKEWAMAPIWGGICGTLALMEALGNDIYRSFRRLQPTSLRIRIEQNLKNLGQELQHKTGFGKHFFQLQYNTANALFQRLPTEASIQRTSNRFIQQGKTLIRKLVDHPGGQNRILAYLLVLGGASIGGLIQSALAATLQQKLEQKDARYSRLNRIP